MTNRPSLIGLAIVALLVFLVGLQVGARYAESARCYYHAIGGNELLSDRDRVWDACACNHLYFPFCS